MADKRTALMVALFFAIYAGVHYYTIARLFSWLGIGIGWEYVGTVSMLVLAFPISSFLEQRYLNTFTRMMYTTSTVWLGALTILLMCVLIGEILIFIASPAIVGIGMIAITSILSGYALFIGRTYVVREHTITADIPKQIRFAVASDVHAGAVHGKKYLQHIVDTVQQRGADALLLPGDLVDGPGRLPDDLLEPLDALNIPVFYSYGNHEFYVTEQEVQRVLNGRDIHVLRNNFVDWNGIRIIGIDDAEDKKQLHKHVSSLTKQDAYNILLYHRPDGLEDAAKAGVGLMLSGHTHNGQVFPFTLLVKLRFPRKKGWYEHNNTKLFVSTGAGTWGPPMRLGSRSEVVLITINPKEKK